MKFQQLVLVSLAPVVALSVACDRKPSLKDEKAKVSYAIGQNIAMNIKAQNIDLDPKVVGYAVTQGLKGEKPEVTPEEQQKAIQNLQQATQARAMEDAQKNKSASDEFLAKNKGKENMKSTASGLQYEVLKEGKGKKPGLKDKVTVHYTGTLINGTKFDSSHDRGQPAEFPLNGIIKGWQEALQLMPEGSVYRLYIPPDLAYGAQPQPGIPAFSTLIFDVELLKVNK
ncbi:MAG TPA: FKBP-type peptidyl-prolyl cis-trans isomerase [Bdellovibrionales bacterium]|jgi:FKBP-type peptidyl-prolyl cis-trans isomerase|nr:FKBP-type peptidyl-prolyl cis-trans isomerase [Bdellovibrionales bacterium]